MSRRLFASLAFGLLLSATSATIAADAPPESAEQIRPLLIGATIPEAILTSADGSPFDLNEAVAKKPTVLIFYRGGW